MSTIQNGLLPRTSLLFTRYAVSVLITFLRNVVEMMTGNPAFATPFPTLASVTTAIDDLETKAQAALGGGRLAVAARRASQVNLLVLARQLAGYVTGRCGGSIETLLSSGFDAQRAPSPVQVPGVPGNPRLGHGKNSGELVLRFIGDSNVRNFSVQQAEDPAGPWTDLGLFTKTAVTIPGLTPGKVYHARARAHGAAGSSDWCPPTSKMAI